MKARALTVVLLAALAGCATSPPRPPEPPPAPARSQRAAATAPARSAAAAPARAAAAPRPAESAGEAAADALPARAQRLFDEAVQAEEEQRKLKVPTDWAYLERKWRAVLDVAEVPEARYNVAVTLEAQGRVDDARAEYQRARDAKPGLRQAAVNLGVLLERQGDPRAAAEVYQGIVRDFPEDALSRARLATLYFASGQTEDASRLAREALMRDPRSVAAYKVLVQAAIHRNDLDLAKLVALRAQKLDPADPELPFFAGQVLARQGDEAAASVQFRKALSLREDFLPARYALLAAAMRKKAWGAVAEHAAAILKNDPSNAQVHLSHGIALRHLGKADEALAAYDRAEKLGGARLPEVHLARGVLFARVKTECEPALAELKAYQRAAGPVVPDGPAVLKLQRECEQMLEENRKALEAAKQMQAEAKRQADAKGAKEPKGAPEGSAVPTSAPSPSR